MATGVTSIAQLVEAAERATRAGDRRSAITAWEQILRVEPRHPAALNAVGNWALAQNDAVRACSLLKAAVAEEPGQPALRFNLASALRAAGDSSAALAEYQEALALDPYFVQAMFQKAVLLEEAGRVSEAARVYKDFLDCAPDDVRKSAKFEPALNRARQAVDADCRALGALITTRLEASDAALGHSLRFREAMDAMLGRSRIYVAEPTFLTVPRLPAIPFFDRDLVPWLDTLEAATDQIAGELLAVVQDDGQGDFTPYVANPPGTPLNQWAALNHSPRWGAYHLWRHGKRDEAHCARCPLTAALLDRMPLVRLPGRAPNAFFSLLKPGTRIPPHTGVTNIRSTVHLPLVVPPDCGFRVGAETRTWEAARAWVFDDTIEHEAWNDGDRPRFILIFDVWNPLLTGEEQRQFATALDAFDEHYGRSVSWSDTL